MLRNSADECAQAQLRKELEAPFNYTMDPIQFIRHGDCQFNLYGGGGTKGNQGLTREEQINADIELRNPQRGVNRQCMVQALPCSCLSQGLTCTCAAHTNSKHVMNAAFCLKNP